MIYIVEIHHQRALRAWLGTREQVISAIAEQARRSGDTIWECTTARQLAVDFGGGEDVPPAWIDALMREHGADTPLYRSDSLNGEPTSLADAYAPEPIDELEAHLVWLRHDLSSLLVYQGEPAARAALADDHEWRRHGGAAAHGALAGLLDPEDR